MYFGSVGGNHLKAQMLNNTAKVHYELYRREITKKHVYSLATINKNIRDMEDFLKDIKANSGYCTDVQEFSSLYQKNFGPDAAKTVQEDVKIVDLNKTHVGRRSSGNKTPPLSRQAISDPDQWRRVGIKTGFGAHQGDGILQLRDEKTEQNFGNKTGGSFSAKNSIGTGNVSGHERARRSYEMKDGKWNTKPAKWPVRDENLMETDRRYPNSIGKNSESRVGERNSDSKELQVILKKSQLQNSPSFLQTKKSSVNGNQGINVQNADTQLPGGKSFKAIYQPSKTRHTWTDRPLKSRDSLSKVGLTGGSVGVNEVNRSQTAPTKASRLQSQRKSASVSERKFDFTDRSSTAKNPSSCELKKLKIHVSLSKTERRRILRELVCNSTVIPDKCFLERQRQILLKDKISKFFESIFEQSDTEHIDNEEDIF